jgi:hypothetical protein
MRLVQDTSPGAESLQVHCIQCKKRFRLSEGYLDVEGKPFVDYYCSFCREFSVRCRNLDRNQRNFD